MLHRQHQQPLKIVSNTQYNSAATKVYVDDLIPRLASLGHTTTVNDWNNYKKYDVVLFASPDAQPEQAKRENPDITVGIMDPKIDRTDLQENVRNADFVVVTSLEQRDALLPYTSNIFVYFSFPDTPTKSKRHTAKDTTIIAYHGNREHLICMYPSITSALDKLAKTHSIEFWAIYNIKKHGRWTKHTPKNAKTRHIQWTPDIYEEVLSQTDIGIVHNSIPYTRGFFHTLSEPLTRYLKVQTYPYRKTDTVTRYKYSANPGRIYPFAQLHIPIVADFTPSMAYFVGNNERGLLAHTPAGWHHALSTFTENPSLRQQAAERMQNFIQKNHSVDMLAAKFSSFLKSQK